MNIVNLQKKRNNKKNKKKRREEKRRIQCLTKWNINEFRYYIYCEACQTIIINRLIFNINTVADEAAEFCIYIFNNIMHINEYALNYFDDELN